MEALTNSLSFNIFTTISSKNRSPSNLTLLGRSDVGFSPSLNFKRLHFDDHLVSFRSNITKSLVVFCAATEVIGLENQLADHQMPKPKTVRVKFQLQKECSFGDAFLLVGDHPMLGLWNTVDAITMNWSDGNIWNVELDVPIETTVQFKFILKQSTGELLWQPGPDRIFKSWESEGTLVVTEDWEDAAAQKITEEQMNNPDFEPIVHDGVMVSGNTIYAEEKVNSEVFGRESSSRTLVPGMATSENN
ncbi:hypothetical protein JCGZ_08481 [Jatropha curcas]|uniref:CBM20 domain-containing protein n=1 Tax=Jatropha curcas TaxID=180498 RepID=A0A067LPP6_JATCU|nr:starch-binding domain-containing protein 1 [Jatropha curcas]KDP46509.1 hypothetical protein JCGZ_08481 [Jatropha curcas]